MRAHQVMTKNVITATPTTPILDAANLILRRHFSGLPVLDETGALVGIITQSDFLHRSEMGTQPCNCAGGYQPGRTRSFDGNARGASSTGYAWQGPCRHSEPVKPATGVC